MKKIILIVILTITLLTICIIGYLSVVYKSTSSQMSQAHTAAEKGDYPRTINLLQQVLKKDPSSEDANRLMAETLEKNENYETSCYYWFVTSTLNPLDKSLPEKAYRAAFLSGQFAYALERATLQMPPASLSDPLFYRLGITAKASRNQKILEAVKEIMIQKQSPYLALLELDEESPDKIEQIRQIGESSISQGVKDTVYFMLGANVFLSGGRSNALEYLDQIAGADECALISSYLVKADCLVSMGEMEEAYENYSRVYKTRPSDIELLLRTVEIGFMLNDAEKVERFRLNLNSSSKLGLSVDYYIQSLASTIRGETKKALQFLELGDPYRNRPVGRLLKFRLAFDLKDYSLAAEAAQILAEETLSSEFRDYTERYLSILVTELYDRLKAEYEGQQAISKTEREILFSLAQSLYKVAPQNSLALHLVMNKALEDNDYQLVLIYAEELLKQNPQMSLAIRSKLQALEELNRFNDGVSYTRAYLKDHPEDPIVTLYGARFEAAMGNTAEAVRLFNLVLPQVPLTVCEEIGNYYIRSEIDLTHFIQVMQDSKDENKILLANGILAKKAAADGDIISAEAYLRKALEINPAAPGVRTALASILYEANKVLEAQVILEEGLKLNPDSFELKVRLASLFLEIGQEPDWQKGIDIISPLCTNQQDNGFPFAILSALYAKQGKLNDAMEAAIKANSLPCDGNEGALQLGMRYLERNNPKEAVEVFTRVFYADSENIRAQEGLLNGYRMLIEDQEADLSQRKAYADALLKLMPENEYGKEVLQKIEAELAAEEPLSRKR